MNPHEATIARVIPVKISTGAIPSDANNQTTTFDYYTGAGDLRLKQIWNKKSGGATVSKFDYVYDAEGRIREWTQQADAATPQVMTLDYDGEDQ